MGVAVCFFSMSDLLMGDESTALTLVFWCFLCLVGVFERERVRDFDRERDLFLERLSLLLDFLCFFLDILFLLLTYLKLLSKQVNKFYFILKKLLKIVLIINSI